MQNGALSSLSLFLTLFWLALSNGFFLRDNLPDQPSTTSDRFVKWINRGHVHRRYQRHALRQTTQESLYGKPGLSKMESLLDDEEEAPSESPDVGDWECLVGVQEYELCALQRTTSGGKQESQSEKKN